MNCELCGYAFIGDDIQDCPNCNGEGLWEPDDLLNEIQERARVALCEKMDSLGGLVAGEELAIHIDDIAEGFTPQDDRILQRICEVHPDMGDPILAEDLVSVKPDARVIRQNVQGEIAGYLWEACDRQVVTMH